MIPIPAIDLRGGQVVRLLQGDYRKETVYSDKPGTIAREFENDGAERIHVVDLDGALKGAPANFASVEEILKTVRVPVEIGGGIRDLKYVARYLDMGVRWVILGTKACLDEGFMREAIREYSDRVIIGIDAKDGWVATDGWTRVTQQEAAAMARSVQSLGGKSVIYTDISKDGALAGPNLDAIRKLAGELTIDVIASGGIGSLKDLEALNRLNLRNVSGVIIGKALYEKKFTVKEAIRCLRNA